MATKERPRWLMRFIWKSHKLVWNASGGRLGTKVLGMPVLELITTGHKSGEPRSILISYVETPAGPAIAGTNAGKDTDPAWVRNLRADPAARVRQGGTTRDVAASFLDGDEHSAAWQQFVDAADDYAGYAGMLTRPIPIVRLHDA